MTTGAAVWAALFCMIGLIFLGVSISKGFDPGIALAGAAFIYLAKN